MLTHTPPRRSPAPAAPARESLVLLMLLVCAWLWPGVFARDLWNPDEPQLFAVIEETAAQSAWLPVLHGEAYFQAAPLYVWLAAALKNLFSPTVLEAYAAARLAGVLLTAAGLAASGLAARELLGRGHGRSTALILIGSAGLLGTAHFLNGQAAAFAAAGLGLYGMSLLKRRVAAAIFLLGAALALAGQAAGWLTAAAMWAVLPLAGHGRRVQIAAAGALAVAVPLAAAQLLVLARTDAAAFSVYLQDHLFGAFGGTGGVRAAFNLPYYAQHLLWFAFPAWGLAAWTLHRGGFRQPAFRLPVCWLAVFALLIALNPQRFQDHLVWLLPPLAVLGAARLDSLKRGVAAFLNWFGVMTFGLAAVFLWLGFLAMNYGFPVKLAERAAYFSPYYIPEIKMMPMAVALSFTPLWLFAVTRKRIRGRQAVTNWAAGITLVWALLMTLFLPWLDAAKSYRPVVARLQAALPAAARADIAAGRGCLHIGDAAARAAWRQYADLPARADGAACAYAVYRFNPQTAAPPAQEKIVWQGRRPRNKTEMFALVFRQPENGK